MTLTEFLKLKVTCNISPETAELRTLDDFERDKADASLWRAGLLNVKKKKKNYHMLHYEQVFRNVLERRKSKCCGVLMRHRHKVNK